MTTSSGGGVTSSGGVETSGGGVEPPSGGGVPQMPRVEPGGMVHGNPGQQSAEVVQVPPLPTQTPPHTKGGKLLPGVYAGLGTQGRPQQSALVAQAWPTLMPA